MQARLDSMAGRRVGYLKLKSFTARTQARRRSGGEASAGLDSPLIECLDLED